MNEPDRFPEEEAEDWYRHPQTQAKHRFWMKRAEDLQKVLYKVCNDSTDHLVREAYANFTSAMQSAATLAPPKKDLNGKR